MNQKNYPVQTTLVVIDPGVENYQSLVDGVVDGAKVFVLDANRDGVQQITEILQSFRSRPLHSLSLHIVSHGAPGTLYLGNGELSLSNLNCYTEKLNSWTSRDLLLYGCNVAAGDAGEEFISKLNSLTNANIFASTTRIGNVIHGDNWQLDFSTNNLKSASLAISRETQQIWEGVLGGSFGTEFWLAFSPNTAAGDASETFFISGEEGTTGTVEIPGLSFTEAFTIPASQLVEISLPNNANLPTSTGVFDQGIHVTSSDDVGVYGVSRQQATSDAYTGIPVDSLGTEYLLLSYTTTIASYPNQLSVVATEDNTTVTITPPGQTPVNITLNQGQVYQLRDTADLTGTEVIASAGVSVFAGVECVNVGQGFCDHIIQQMTPVEGWGNVYITAPIPQPERHRILASENGTEVTVNGAVVATLNRGEFYEFTDSGAHEITSTAPILVAKYAEGDGSGGGDPSLMIMPGIDNFISDATFATGGSQFTNFVIITALSSGISNITLDGAAITETWQQIGSSDYSYVQIQVTDGTHTLSNEGSGTLFGATVYGEGSSDSYGYVAGSNVLGLPPFNLDPASDTGISNGDFITNENTPTFTGTADQNANLGDVITIYADGVEIGTGTVQGDLSWSVTTSTLAEGVYAVTATITSGGVESDPSNATSVEIDLTPPTVSSPDLATASDTGSSDTDDLTSDPTPVFEGTVEDGSTVQIFDGGTVVGDAVVTGTTWTFTPSSDLAEGTYTYTATATDAAGNTADSGGLTFTVDSTAPSTPVAPTLTIASDSGSSSFDAITSVTTPTIEGTATVGNQLGIYNNGVLIDTIDVTSANWSYTFSSLSEGHYNITVVEIDNAGNTSSASSGLSIGIDATAPVPVITEVTPDPAATPPESFSINFGEEISEFDITNFALTLDSAPVDLSGIDPSSINISTSDSITWSISGLAPALTDEGTYVLTVTGVTDFAGNTMSSPVMETWMIDTSAPTVGAPVLAVVNQTGNAPTSTNSNSPTVEGTTDPNSSVEVFVDGNSVGVVMSDGSGNWSMALSLGSNGTYSVTTQVTDGASNISPESAALALVVDNVAPTVALSNNLGAQVNEPFTVTATFSEPVFDFDSSDIALTNAMLSNFMGSGDTYTFLVTPSSDGAVSVNVNGNVAQDGAGNDSVAADSQLDVTVDITPPSQPPLPEIGSGVETTMDGDRRITRQPKPEIGGTGAEPNGTVELYIGDRKIGEAPVDGSGNWIVTPPNDLEDGTYQIVARIKDSAGNSSPDSSPIEITIDTTGALGAVINLDQPVRDSGVEGITISFNEQVLNFDTSDISLTLDGAPIDLTGAVLTSSDDINFLLSNIPGFAEDSGNYQIDLSKGDITDLIGNGLIEATGTEWLTGYTSDPRQAPDTSGKDPSRVGGSRGEDSVRGSNDRDIMSGRGGNDRLRGRGGNDKIRGGAGKDKISGGKGNDQISGGKDNDTLTGRGGDDRIVGNGGNDSMRGGGGDDLLFGKKGRDSMNGGKGEDTFLFRRLAAEGDKIRQFNVEDDVIDVRGIFNKTEFSGDNRFARFREFIDLVQVGANTEVQIDADGSGSGTEMIKLVTLNGVDATTVRSENFVIGNA
ncbi:MAG: Ig-like domain-containing protein [Cyanobacteria bacterium P01_E01_bin.6]